MEKLEKFGGHTPLGRPGQPVELASIYVQLAASDASYANGQVYGSSGGAGQPCISFRLRFDQSRSWVVQAAGPSQADRVAEPARRSRLPAERHDPRRRFPCVERACMPGSSTAHRTPALSRYIPWLWNTFWQLLLSFVRFCCKHC